MMMMVDDILCSSVRCFFYYYFLFFFLLLIILSSHPSVVWKPVTHDKYMLPWGEPQSFSREYTVLSFSTMSYTPDHDKHLARILRNKRSRERVKRSDQDSGRQNSGSRLREQKLQRENDADENGGHTGTEFLGNLVAVSSKVVQYHRNYHGLDVRGADCEKPKPTNNVTTPSQNTHALKVLQKLVIQPHPCQSPKNSSALGTILLLENR